MYETPRNPFGLTLVLGACGPSATAQTSAAQVRPLLKPPR